MLNLLDIFMFVLLIAWPFVFVEFFLRRIKIYLTQSYLAILVSTGISFLYAYFYYRNFVTCKNESVLVDCSVFPEYLVIWYSEWSLVFNIIVSALIVLTANLFQQSRLASEI